MWDVPFIALTTDFVRVRRDLTSPSDSPASNASDTPPSELSDCLWNALRADHLLRQAVSLLTLSPTLLAVPGDRYMIYFGIAVNFALYSATTAYFGYICTPRPAQSWLITVVSCSSKIYLTTDVQAVFNVVSDFYLLLLPIPVVWKLPLSTKKKIGVCGIFATGFL